MEVELAIMYDDYDEDLIPARVPLTVNGKEVEVDGFRGAKTGEVYYTRDTICRAGTDEAKVYSVWEPEPPVGMGG